MAEKYAIQEIGKKSGGNSSKESEFFITQWHNPEILTLQKKISCFMHANNLLIS
jgi:hypothetical protein